MSEISNKQIFPVVIVRSHGVMQPWPTPSSLGTKTFCHVCWIGSGEAHTQNFKMSRGGVRIANSSRRQAGVAIWAFGAMFVLYTPLQSDFMLHIGSVHCGLSVLDLSLSLTNSSHVIGYGLFALLVLRHLGDRARFYPRVLFFVFLFSLFVEFTQLFFVGGHFRLRDMFANFVGISGALALHGLTRCYTSNGAGNRIACSWMPAALHILLGLGLGFGFKQVSQLIGS